MSTFEEKLVVVNGVALTESELAAIDEGDRAIAMRRWRSDRRPEGLGSLQGNPQGGIPVRLLKHRPKFGSVRIK